MRTGSLVGGSKGVWGVIRVIGIIRTLRMAAEGISRWNGHQDVDLEWARDVSARIFGIVR